MIFFNGMIFFSIEMKCFIIIIIIIIIINFINILLLFFFFFFHAQFKSETKRSGRSRGARNWRHGSILVSIFSISMRERELYVIRSCGILSA